MAEVFDPNREFVLGVLRVDPVANEIHAGDQSVRLEARTMAVLVYLAAHAGQAVRREALMDSVWRGRIVTDDSLTRAVVQLRQILRDPTAIETIPKVGYRLRWPVAQVPAAPSPIAPIENEVGAVKQRPRLSYWQAAIGLLLILGGVVLVVSRIPSPVLVEAPRVARVTPLQTVPGVKRLPRFSPSGRQLVFDVQAKGSSDRDIYHMDLDSGVVDALVQTPATEQHPDWSPDGRLVYFVRSMPDEDCRIMRLELASRLEHVVHRCNYSRLLWPRVSPDGQRMVFSDLVTSRARAAVFELELATGKVTQKTFPKDSLFDLSPSYTADGKHILWVRGSLASVRDLYALDRVSGEVTLRYSDPVAISDAHASPDGGVLLAVGATGQSQLVWLDHKGLEFPLPLTAQAIRGPAMDPGQSRVIYESWIVREQIDQFDPAGETKTLVQSSRMDYAPNWSPDGKSLAFLSTRDGSLNIWIQRDGVDSAVTRYRVERPEFLSWHPDSQRIAWSITTREGAFVCVANAFHGDSRCRAASGASSPYFTADGQRLGFSAPDGDQYSVYEVPVDELDAPGTRMIPDAYFAQPTPNGGLCFQRGGRDGVWCRDAHGQDVSVLPMATWFAHRNWRVHGERVYWLDRSGEVTVVDLNGNLQQRFRVDGWIHPQSGLDVDAAGRIAFGNLTTYESELMLAELEVPARH